MNLLITGLVAIAILALALTTPRARVNPWKLGAAAALTGLSLAFGSPEYMGAAIVATLDTPLDAGPQSPTYKSWTLTALDADTTLNIAHGFNFVPRCIVQELVSYALTAIPCWGVTADATNVTVVKNTSTASGGATPGTTVIARVFAFKPNRIM